MQNEAFLPTLVPKTHTLIILDNPGFLCPQFTGLRYPLFLPSLYVSVGWRGPLRPARQAQFAYLG